MVGWRVKEYLSWEQRQEPEGMVDGFDLKIE